jgi:hypothetical protein
MVDESAVANVVGNVEADCGPRLRPPKYLMSETLQFCVVSSELFSGSRNSLGGDKRLDQGPQTSREHDREEGCRQRVPHPVSGYRSNRNFHWVQAVSGVAQGLTTPIRARKVRGFSPPGSPLSLYVSSKGTGLNAYD